MKKITLFLIVFLGVFTAQSQPNSIVGAPANTNGTTAQRAPNGTSAHTTLRAHIIITAAEMASIPSGTVFNGLGFLYAAAANVPATGNIQFYLENTTDVVNNKSTTWSTAISTMTSVYNGAYTIPSASLQTNVPTSTPFTYTGGGLYVAYDYVGSTFATTSATYYCEYLAVPGGTKVAVSATTTAPTVLNLTSAYRPEIQFSFANPYTNNLAVKGLFPRTGKHNLLLGNTQNVETVISNLSSVALTNVPVSLGVTGANAYTSSQTIASIAPGADVTVNFAGVPIGITGTQTVTITLPADQQTSNDTYSLTQDIFCDSVGYSFGNTISSGLGYDTGTGILANLLVVPAGAPVYVNKVVPVIATGVASTGNTIKGVLLNSAGVIIDSTANYTIVAADLGQPVSLKFINGGINVAGDSVYYGFRQNANTVTGYFPLATQDLSGFVPVDLFCGFGAYGGSYANYTTFGVSMMSAILNSVDLTTNAINGGICQATPLNLSVASSTTPSVSFITDGTVAQTGALTTYSYTPTATTTAKVQKTIGSCTYADSAVITQIAPVNAAVSFGLCPGSNYNFNGTIITTAGTYVDTIPSSIGCDSIITLTVSNISSVTNSVSASICQGASYAFGGQNLTTAGTYVDTLQSSAGCDSIVTLTLGVNMPSASTLIKDICGTNYQFGGQNLTASGTYTNTLTNAAGCDSVVTLQLTLSAPASVTVAQAGSILTATSTPSTATLQWVDCPGFTPVTGATSATFQPTTVIGSYAVIATTPAGCTDTSTCFAIDMTGIDELDLASTIKLYPNPTVDLVFAVSDASPIVGYKVYDMTGRAILTSTIEGGATQIEFSVAGFENGMYKLELYTNQNTITKTFVKK